MPARRWLIPAVVVAGLTALAIGVREDADTLHPSDEPQAAQLDPVIDFAHEPGGSDLASPFRSLSGTAFAIAREGRWVTARHVVEGCRRPALKVGEGRALAADVRLAPGADLAVLLTEGGPPALAVRLDRPPLPGERGFHPGFPQDRAGEVTTRLLGAGRLRMTERGRRDEIVLAWAEIGRTAGLDGALSGLSGAPVLDSQGRALGVTIAEAPRRGRIFTTAPAGFAAALRGVQTPDEPLTGRRVTVADYGAVSDALRRDLRVAQVVCLPG